MGIDVGGAGAGQALLMEIAMGWNVHDRLKATPSIAGRAQTGQCLMAADRSLFAQLTVQFSVRVRPAATALTQSARPLQLHSQC